MMTQKFFKIVENIKPEQNVIQKIKHIVKGPCQDVIIEESFIFDNLLKKDYQFKKRVQFTTSPDNIILILLESPHTKEYTNLNTSYFSSFDEQTFVTTPSPALGNTGCNITRCLHYLLNDLNMTNQLQLTDKISYHIILMNVIQYPCSLLQPTKNYRNNIFEKCCNEVSFQDDFKNRLAKYKPKIIINCCTKGNNLKSPNTLTEIVHTLIKDCYQSQRQQDKPFVFQFSHPSSWNLPDVNITLSL